MSSSSDEEYRSYHRAYPLHDAAEAGDMETLTHILRPARQQQQQPKKASVDGVEGAGAEGAQADGGVVAMDEDGGVNPGEGSAGDGGDVEKAAEAADRDGDGIPSNNNNSKNNGNSNNINNGAAFSDDDDDNDDDDGFRPPSVDMEERDQEGCTPLHVALSAKKLDAARLLLECGAGTTRRLEGSTPAHIALSVASVGRHRGFADAALKLLLEHHHDVSVKDDRGQTLLHVAASFGLEDAIATLLQAPGGRELMDSKERLNCRPLHLAALGGHVGATRALIEAGCDTSLSNLHGNTALHLACAKARWGVARVLLDLGKASVAACNKNKQIPAAMALKRGLKIPDTLPELQQKGAGGAGAGDDNDSSINGAPAKRAKKNQPAKWQFQVAGGPGATGTGDGAVAVVAGAGAKQGVQAEEEGAAAAEAATAASGDGVVGGGGGSAGVIAAAVPRTAVLHHPLCLEHHSCPPIRRSGADPPPENVKRLEVIYNEDSGVLRADEFSSLEWDSNPSRAQLADVLRVHDFNYVEKLERLCAKIPDVAGSLSHLDGDTAISHNSFEAAMRAAGSVCDAVDRVMMGRNRNAFCAVRPPGHHAGPRGLVTCGNDAQGSHGFCLLNNVAIGAAYARCMHRHTGVDRVAIVDFDVHHGNGTEDIVKALVPKVEEAKIKTPFCQGVLHQVSYNPWLNPEDPDKCLFVSVHGYGKKDREFPGGWFYPGSGATTDCDIPNGGGGRRRDQRRCAYHRRTPRCPHPG